MYSIPYVSSGLITIPFFSTPPPAGFEGDHLANAIQFVSLFIPEIQNANIIAYPNNINVKGYELHGFTVVPAGFVGFLKQKIYIYYARENNLL